MAVFFDTGGGDIYGGPDKEAVLAAIRKDVGDKEFNNIEEEIYEVPGTMKMRVEREDGDYDPTDKLVTLKKEYVESLGAYCIASTNY
jgi:hypothetical protein